MKKIIIVDDNALSIEGICKSIDWKALNSEVCATFSNGQEAIQSIDELDPDLIISDISMPILNGIDMAKIVLKTHPYIKIIFISAYEDFKYAKEAIRMDICDYVEKPIDYDYLSRVIREILIKIQNENDILEQLNKNRPALIQNFFNDLIHSSPDYAQFFLKDQAKYLNIDITSKKYVCGVIQINNFLEVMRTFGIERYHVLLMKLIQDINELFSKPFHYFCNNQGHHLIIHIGNKTSKPDFIKSVNNLFFDINKRYLHSALSLTIGIGDVIHSVWDTSISYQNAKHAIDYKFVFEEEQILNFKDIQRNPSPVFFTSNDEELLIKLVSQKNLLELKQFIVSLPEKWSKLGLEKNGIFAYIYTLLARLIRFLYDIGIDDPSFQNKAAKIYINFDKFESTTRICESLYNLCSMACQKLQESMDTHQIQVVEQAVHYIEKNYMYDDIGLNTISSVVNISPSYLGSIFKKVKKQSITKYITSIRIAKSQEYLSTTNLKILEISEKVGYSNQYYFSACFKKITGKTPSEYRSESQLFNDP
ncbi:response regulator [Terrilactibacillus laevilacticus]|uniref:Response regulator n=1 Tax=Terrilactibacillus laevilacticus TaxID=1380157 RepID=A0ABW5PUN9_9BACI|nr:response regulator [Terrilactibacillus laevilacticus]